MPMNTHPAIAVHLHLYYVEMWGTIRDYLKNLEDYPYRLFVTMVKEAPELAQEIRNFHADTEFYLVENRGYDVGPFVHVLNQIEPEDYEFILKIHTKNDNSRKASWCNILYISRWTWAHLLLRAVLGAKEQVRANIETLRRHPQIGMIGAANLIIRKPEDMPVVERGARELLAQFGFPNQRYEFVAGTMFIARSAIFRKIKDTLTLSDFEESAGSGSDGTLAHVMERVFGGLTLALGYNIQGVRRSLAYELAQPYGRFVRLWGRFVRFTFQKKITRRNRVIIKMFKIPVYYSFIGKAERR